MGIGASDYRRMLQALLPVGPAWPRDEGAVLTDLLAAWAEEFARLNARADDLLNEADPSTASELLPEWELDYGLGGEGAAADRQAAIEGAMNARGGVSPQYFMDLAAAAGVGIALSFYRPFQVGRSTVGETLSNGTWLFTWNVIGPASTSTELQAELEALFLKLKPSHTAVTFDWSA